MKKFISAICVIALMMPSTLSAFAETNTSKASVNQTAVAGSQIEDGQAEEDGIDDYSYLPDEDENGSPVVDGADDPEVTRPVVDEAEKTQSESGDDDTATSVQEESTNKSSMVQTTESSEEEEAESESGLDPKYADDPQYWKEMKKQYGIATMSAEPSGYVHNPRFNNGYKIHYGVDVSSYQPNIDWAKAKADGVEFAIIRAGFRGWGSGGIFPDDDLIKNIKGARAQGIKVGVYIFSQAITEAEAREEVDKTIEFLQGQQIDLPMVLDYEYAESYDELTGRLYNANLTRQQATDVCLAFCDYASQKGYKPMVYANKDMLTNKLYADKISSKYSIWLANYTSQTSYTGDYEFWQYSSSARVNGIPGNPKTELDKNIDGDFWYEAIDSHEVTLDNYTAPQCMEAGEGFSVEGSVSSGLKLDAVTVGVYDGNNHQVTGGTAYPGTYTYDLSALDASVKISGLSGGMYHYKVIVQDSEGEHQMLDKVFSVRSNSPTIQDGIYLIASAKNQNKVLSVDNNRNTSGTNILLWNRSEIPYRQFQFTYQGNGYYKIKNMGSGLYLSAAGQRGSSGTNVEQSSSATLWQVLPDGAGGYYIVPNCSYTSCLDLYTGIPDNGKNIDLWNYNMRGSQRWYLISSSAKPSISGQTIPGNMQQGSSFSIRGTVSSREKITSVTVGAYDTNGRMKIGKTAQTNAKAYNLKNLDTSIKFGSLPAGAYRYKVTVKTTTGTYTLINRIFMVKSNGRTVSNGTYRLVLAQNKNYAISVDRDGKTSGTNLLLWANRNVAFRRFKFTYQSNGYYTIKNEGSGLYLSVKGQGSASGSNVELSSSATQWQVLPDGTGSYYLVPKCSSTSCLDMYSGVPANGKNIEIWNYNMGKAQRWSLVK